MYFGPNVPYVYRLQGPGRWDGARQAIMSVDERVLYPLATRKVENSRRKTENSRRKTGLVNLLSAIAIASIALWMGYIFHVFKS